MRRTSSSLGAAVSHPPVGPSTNRPALATPAPNPPTGVPNKYYRGPQQGSFSGGQPLTTLRRTNKPKTRPPTPNPPTGVPNKHYRGPRQVLPGCPTNIAGVSDKYYRGAQQVALSKVAAKRGFSCRVFGRLCFCLSCSVMLLNNNYRENGEVWWWGPIASS